LQCLVVCCGGERALKKKSVRNLLFADMKVRGSKGGASLNDKKEALSRLSSKHGQKENNAGEREAVTDTQEKWTGEFALGRGEGFSRLQKEQ